MSSSTLIIDSELERLIPQLSHDELELLEKSILEEGCLEPLYVWNGTILDGHHRYRICNKHHIPFKSINLSLVSKDEAIVWICIHQTGRRNISDETRHYLIGKRYEAEKRMGIKNPSGKNQYSKKNEDAPTIEEHPQPPVKARYTSTKLGKIYGLGHHTIEKYGRYAKDLDAIDRAAPELSSKILSGDIFISMDTISDIANLTEKQIQIISDSIPSEMRGHIQQDQIMDCIGRKQIKRKAARPVPPREVLSFPIQTVKDTPQYDPDSEIASLTLTMPSWIASMNRTLQGANMALITSDARTAFKRELLQLRETVENILQFI